MADKNGSDEPATRNGSRSANGASPDQPDEYVTFEDLARKLMQVPKPELDEQREAAKPAKA